MDAITHHFFFIALVVIQGADWAALLSSSLSPDVTGLSSVVSFMARTPLIFSGTVTFRDLETAFLVQELIKPFY